ncbi:MAG: hypothetical protein K8R99_14515 [Actinomycetia bacterium]|nr:hypothetical protein [Actinomycetes bacterium]
MKRFAMTRPLSDVDALSALLKHQRYQDHYATDEAHWIPTGDLHGPYRLSLLGVGSFVQVKPATARQTLRDWAKEYDGEHAEGFADVLQTSAAVLNDEMTILYLLADRDVTGHDWGWVLGDFYEFVVINRGSDQLSLVVASDD